MTASLEIFTCRGVRYDQKGKKYYSYLREDGVTSYNTYKPLGGIQWIGALLKVTGVDADFSAVYTGGVDAPTWESNVPQDDPRLVTWVAEEGTSKIIAVRVKTVAKNNKEGIGIGDMTLSKIKTQLKSSFGDSHRGLLISVMDYLLG